jgi:hypothetical protein
MWKKLRMLAANVIYRTGTAKTVRLRQMTGMAKRAQLYAYLPPIVNFVSTTFSHSTLNNYTFPHNQHP